MKPHRARIIAMQAVFQQEFNKKNFEELSRFVWIDYVIPEDERDYACKIIKGVLNHTENIDKLITIHSKNWKIERISSVSRAILRISIFQILYMAEELSVKIIIDEAIKIAKEYGEDDSTRFINGILDAINRDNIKSK